MASILSEGEIADQSMHKDDNKVANIITCGVLMGLIAITAVALRFLSRRIARTKIGADDWCIVTGLVS